MTALDTIPSNDLVPITANFPTQASLVSDVVARWADDIESCAGLAARIIRTELVPVSYWPLPFGVKLWEMPDGNPRRRHPRETPEQYQDRLEVATATTAGSLYTGAQLGLQSWNAALQGIDYIRGRQSLRSEFIEALYLGAGHKFEVIERSPERAAVRLLRRGESKWAHFEFTMKEAIDAGYVKGKGPDEGKNKGNEKYLTLPATMLWWRVISMGVHAHAPEVLRGLPTIEEMQDDHPVEVTAKVVEPAPRVSAAAVLAAASPPASEAVEQAPAPAVAPEQDLVDRYILPVSKTQLDLLKARFEQLGIGGRSNAMREARMRVLSELVSHDISDPRQLTNDEAKLCFDNLLGDPGLRICQDLGVIPSDPQTEVGDPKEAPASDLVSDNDPPTDRNWPGDDTGTP